MLVTAMVRKKNSKQHPGAKRRPNTSTRRCGCPMVINVVRERSSGEWLIDHRGKETTHNHPPTTTPSSHPILRRADRNESVKEAIASDADIGIRADQTIAKLRAENPETSITARDVYNERQRSVAERLGSRSRIEHLLSILRGDRYTYAVQLDPIGRVTHLFFAFNETIEVFSTNNDVLIMDCTYKTNGFDLPLFNIVGVSGMNSTLHVAQVFLRGETEVDYDWALTKLKEMLTNRQIGLPKVFIVDRSLALLNSLERIFPSIPVLLCIWHIMKDVEAHIRIRTFPKELDPERSGPRSPKLRDSAKHREFCDAFVALLYSPTQQIYEIRHEKLKMLSAVETVYVDDVWLDIWRRRIVRCWTNKVMHYGMQTSRVEGYHSTLKQWLNSSTGDLLTLHTRMVQWWQSSLAKYRTAVSDAQVKTKNLLRQALFAKVVRVIHDHALLLCLDELNIISQSPCSGEYARVMGLPCSHKLWSLVRSNGFLKPDDFDAHWWIDRSAAPVSEHQVILDPIRI